MLLRLEELLALIHIGLEAGFLPAADKRQRLRMNTDTITHIPHHIAARRTADPIDQGFIKIYSCLRSIDKA